MRTVNPSGRLCAELRGVHMGDLDVRRGRMRGDGDRRFLRHDDLSGGRGDSGG